MRCDGGFGARAAGLCLQRMPLPSGICLGHSSGVRPARLSVCRHLRAESESRKNLRLAPCWRFAVSGFRGQLRELLKVASI